MSVKILEQSTAVFMPKTLLALHVHDREGGLTQEKFDQFINDKLYRFYAKIAEDVPELADTLKSNQESAQLVAILMAIMSIKKDNDEETVQDFFTLLAKRNQDSNADRTFFTVIKIDDIDLEPTSAIPISEPGVNIYLQYYAMLDKMLSGINHEGMLGANVEYDRNGTDSDRVRIQAISLLVSDDQNSKISARSIIDMKQIEKLYDGTSDMRTITSPEFIAECCQNIINRFWQRS